ncbi:MAG: indole-3-glycerol phosphate synthase TrpC [Actinobacteria bacterium]|nr:indole-3-glycerol phosphate synthase TrpC [Actinomycetota bacterium]
MMALNKYLERIVNCKRNEVSRTFASLSIERLKYMCSETDPARDFRTSLKRDDGVAIIAEFKRRSPSKGMINFDAQPEITCKQFELGGADAVSVLTDEEFFGGHISHIKSVRDSVRLPILRKDFIINEVQIYESRIKGADAVLLIAKIMSKERLAKFVNVCQRIGIHALVEVHDEAEIQISLEAGADIVGINNRNLDDFSIDLKVTERLIKRIPDSVVKVSESGIRSRDDVLWLQGLGVDAVLIGELLMRSGNVEAKLMELKGLT